MRVVLDTNVLLVSISSRSKYHWIFRALLEERFERQISNEILTEYEEVIAQKLSPDIAKSVVRTLLELPNVVLVTPSFRWNLITADPDDNKFADCAVAGNAHCLVIEDRHFKALDDLEFPKLRRLGIAELWAWLNSGAASVRET